MCILIDAKHKALINSKTNEKVFPACFDDLVAYVSYLMTSKHPEQAQQKLKDVFKGEKVVSDMIRHAQGVK